MKGFLLPFIIIAVLGGIFGVTRASEAQDLKLSKVKISLNLDQVSLKKALSEIENRTAFTFAFSYSAINLDRTISITAHDKSVEYVLKHLFKRNRVSWGLSGWVILLKKWPDQNKTGKEAVASVKGIVRDAGTGETLPGVNISIKGTTMGTSSDKNGHYTLNVPSLTDTLLFSFIGYERKEVAINGRTEINVDLQPTTISGEEIVVVGYGTEKKENLIGSVSSISNKELEDKPITNSTQALQGAKGVYVNQVGGAQPGRDQAQIRIRGLGTLNNNDALILVDGVEYPLAKVDPNNIESISVLKDAAASAIYG